LSAIEVPKGASASSVEGETAWEILEKRAVVIAAVDRAATFSWNNVKTRFKGHKAEARVPLLSRRHSSRRMMTTTKAKRSRSNQRKPMKKRRMQ
jgi:hypothetical protein